MEPIELQDIDFQERPYSWNDAPDTLSVIAEVIYDKGIQSIVFDFCGAHATKLIGRFGNGNPALHQLLTEITEKESQINFDSKLVEIVHLPEARTGNILRRPDIRGFEIPFLAKSNLSSDEQIKLEDILVTIENNQVCLYHKTTKSRILPKLSNAHNFGVNSLPIYHFLCDLEFQMYKGFGFDWGDFFTDYTFLPRVTYKHCVLSKAKWQFEVKNLYQIVKVIDNKSKTLQQVSVWRKRHIIPEFIQLVDGDNTIVINLGNYTSISMFFKTIKNRKKIILQEFLYGNPSQTANIDSNQFIFSFYNDKRLNDRKNKG